MTNVDVMIWTFLVAAVWIGTGLICYYSGKRVERQDQEELQALQREHRARQLRERGRIHDVRPDATGEPATVHPIVVLGKSPRHKPPTRM